MFLLTKGRHEHDRGGGVFDLRLPSLETGPEPGMADEPAEGPPLKEFKVDLDELILALEGWGPDEMRHYLDTETGGIIPLWDDADDYDEWREKIDADGAGRYRKIDTLASHQSFGVMEQFTLSLPESSRESRALRDALSRSKPFRRFKDIVLSDLELRDRWFAFRDREYAALAREWLEGKGIEPEWTGPRRPEPD